LPFKRFVFPLILKLRYWSNPEPVQQVHELPVYALVNEVIEVFEVPVTTYPADKHVATHTGSRT
jgi:hypothetical protein